MDDDQEILDIYKMILSEQGYFVKTSIFPADILTLILEFEPNLIMLDINMNEINGLEVCKEVKSYVSNKNTPVIIISSDESIHTAICDFSATAIILKPFDVDNLIETVRKNLEDPATVS